VKGAVQKVISAHEAAGTRFEAGGVGSFVLEQGDGDPVVCLHGVPVSSFLYRKVVPELAQRGLRGVAFDFPGLGLAERPRDFDYSWSGLARWTGEAIEALGIERCHLVVHDIGGPVGFEWAIRNPERVMSLTALNTLVDAASFHAGARRGAPDPATRQALPPGGPGPRCSGRGRHARRPLSGYSTGCGSGRSRAPLAISSGPPRSGKGISIRSKSRGASVGSKTSRASSRTLPTW